MRTSTKVIPLTSRQGRAMQRYSKTSGGRLVVGCIPYRFEMDLSSCEDGDLDVGRSLQVLIVSSQKGNSFLFPKGGWEIDETIKEAARREALEEAGVQGNIKRKLGKWMYKSRSSEAIYEGFMFPLHVTNELSEWPESKFRQRRWVSVAEAKEECPHIWMGEALERLVTRLSKSAAGTNSPKHAAIDL